MRYGAPGQGTRVANAWRARRPRRRPPRDGVRTYANGCRGCTAVYRGAAKPVDLDANAALAARAASRRHARCARRPPSSRHRLDASRPWRADAPEDLASPGRARRRDSQIRGHEGDGRSAEGASVWRRRPERLEEALSTTAITRGARPRGPLTDLSGARPYLRRGPLGQVRSYSGHAMRAGRDERALDPWRAGRIGLYPRGPLSLALAARLPGGVPRRPRRPAAEDIAQEAFLAAIRTRSLRPPPAVRALAAPHRRQPRDRLGTRTPAARRGRAHRVACRSRPARVGSDVVAHSAACRPSTGP